MAILSPSLRYTMNGRKRKKVYSTQTKKQVSFEPLVLKSVSYNNNSQYPSQDDIGVAVKKDAAYKQEVSSKYTIAPAYNKGAYQVISRENVKDIGR